MLKFIVNFLLILTFSKVNATPPEEKIPIESISSKLQDLRNQVHDFPGIDRLSLEMFDYMTEEWQNYYQQNQAFNVSILVKASDLLITKEIERFQKDGETALPHVIRISQILWNDGKVRSINVLTSALLDHIEETGVTDEEVLKDFGSRVLYVLNDDHGPVHSEEEHRQAHVDVAPNQCIEAQMLQLAHRIERLRYSMGFDQWPPEKQQAYLNWNQKLLEALHGANKDLEITLKSEILAKTQNNL